ncbi:hypothetical protein ACSBR1_038044 [Camellia fascicularis]
MHIMHIEGFSFPSSDFHQKQQRLHVIKDFNIINLSQQNTVEDIRDEFQRMSAFLRVADATEERDPELKVWVKQVRDAAYDTEYVLDKFKLHLAQHHGDGFSGFLPSTCCEETNGHVYDLMPLSQEESWTLFCNKTFRGNLCPPNLKQISLRILKRCEGLPLAIVAIGGVLATKDRSRIEEWEMLYRSLGAELEDNDKLGSLKKALSLSYNDLPYYLKICFLYLSIFPEDQQIWCEKVIRLWTAEGFVNAIEGKTIEEVANGHLNELFNRSLIQVGYRFPDGRPSHFHIHDLMRLRWVRVEEGAMPHLQDLTIRNSELMEEVPSGIEHLTNLQTFELCEMSEKLMSKLDREVQDEDYRNIAHIPEVRIWYWEHDQWKVKFL